jgi:uncharacterized protein (DUF362 family)
MSVLIEKTSDRERFIRKAFEKFRLEKALRGKEKILLKPNVVSYESYPTTTHPKTIESLIRILQKMRKEILVADGPAPDAGDANKIFQSHPIKKVCDRYGVEFLNLYNRKFLKMRSKSGFTLRISEVPFKCDYIFSLPVLKNHKIAGFTGALKNQFGLLGWTDRYMLHSGIKNFHRGIAELNTMVRTDFYIMDAVLTYCNAQERRWGATCKRFGYMMAGNDGLELDIEGYKLLKTINQKFREKGPESVGYIRFAKEMSKK